MPRPRKSEAELRLKGTWRKDRHGPILPPEGEPLERPPKGLPADVRAAWEDIVSGGEGRLVQADAVLVELAARSLAAVRGPEAKASHSATLLRALVALQLDPAHRREIERPDADNPFNQF